MRALTFSEPMIARIIYGSCCENAPGRHGSYSVSYARVFSLNGAHREGPTDFLQQQYKAYVVFEVDLVEV